MKLKPSGIVKKQEPMTVRNNAKRDRKRDVTPFKTFTEVHPSPIHHHMESDASI